MGKKEDDQLKCSLENLEKNIYQEWLENWFGIGNVEFGDEESIFEFFQDGKKYWAYQWKDGKKLVLVSEIKFSHSLEVPFIGCSWFGPNMRICKFPKPIISFEEVKETTEKLLL